MPTDTIQLVGTYNQRGIDGQAALTLSQDQQFLNCLFDVVQNPVTGKGTVYVEKRPGWGVSSVVEAGSASTGNLRPQSFNATLSAFGNTNSVIYYGTTSVGTITGRALHFTETLISNVGYVLIRSSDGTGWYYVNGAKDDLTYVGDTHIGTAVIDSLDNTTGVYVGQAWSGTGVAAGARVLSVDSASQITLNANSSADGTDISFTKTPIAKILDADFITTGDYISAFVDMSGFVVYTDDTKFWVSDINSVTSYTSTAFGSPNTSPDPPVALVRQNERIVLLGTASIEPYYNAGLTPNPFVRSTPVHNIGTLDQRSVTTREDDVYFVSTPQTGDIGVYRMRGLVPTRISPPHLDRIIGTAAASGSIYASSFRLGGYAYAAFVLSTASEATEALLLESGDFMLQEDDNNLLLESNPAQTASFSRMLVYNEGLNIWSEWDCDEATFIHGIGSGTANQLIATSRVNTSGKVYTINPVADGELYQDDGSAYSCVIRTSKVDHGTRKRKFVNEIRLDADEQSSGTVTLEASDDDYGSWVTLGTFDLTQPQPKITRCGSYTGGRAYRLTHSDNAAFRASKIEIDFEVGTS